MRLWVDRAFSIKGSGTVVTGTLAAGTIAERQELLLTPALATVRVRGIESLKQRAAAVTGVARVAVNLRGRRPGAAGPRHGPGAAGPVGPGHRG